MRIINLTPHVIRVVNENNELIAIYQRSGKVARISKERVRCGQIGNIPIFTEIAYVNKDLPEPEEDTFFIVSTLTRVHNPDRTDLLSPNDLQEGSNRKVKSCKSFIANLGT